MKYLLLFFLLFATNVVYGQKTFIIDNFSNDYYGKLHVENAKEVFSKGWIAIYSKKTNRQLIKVESDELAFTVHDGQVKANIEDLPYGEQSTVIYKDFNFDGKKDFALMDGQFSCYHGPSFQIYLATDSGFKHNIEFTRLAQEYCGMFQVDSDQKIIRTMTKSGAGWHQYSDFMVQGNKPIAIKIVEETMNPTGFIWDYVEKNRVNGKMIEKRYSLFYAESGDENTFYSFEFNNGKKMRLVGGEEGDNLCYIFTDANGVVELFYMDQFRYSKKENAVWFENDGTIYKVILGAIIITTKSKEITMKAKSGTIYGSLNKLGSIHFRNVM